MTEGNCPLVQGRPAAARRFRIDPGQRVGAELIAGIDFDDHVLLVEVGEDARHMTLAEGVIAPDCGRQRC